MLEAHSASSPLEQVVPVIDAAGVRALSRAVRSVYVSDAVHVYAVLTADTRTHPDLRLGASPRATLHLVRACRAHAALDGRDYVIPDAVQALAVPVLAHRLSRAARATPVLTDLMGRLPMP
jgi:MoxR-like ATPase